MINLYRANETNFKHNEFVLSEATLCDITEELNGTFELDLEYPLKDSKGISKQLVTGAIIKVPMDDGREPQLFCLRRPKATLAKIEGYAQHIAITKLGKNMIKDTNIVGKTRKEAMQQVLANTMYAHNFIVGSKDTNTNINNLRIVRYSPLNAIRGSDENTIINRYGGELIFDNFTLDMVDTRGEDTGLIISYKKNLTGVELTTDDLELVTEVIPIGNDGILLPEYSIKSPKFNNYVDAYIKEVQIDIGVVEPSYDSNDVLTNADEVFTQDQVYQYMRQYVANMYTYEEVDQLKFNLTVNFVQLKDTEEYKSYKDLARVKQVGDIVTIKHEILGLNLTGRVQKIKRNILTNRIKEIEIGFSKKSIIDIVKETTKQVAKVTNSVTTVEKTIVDTNEKLTSEIKESKKSTSDLKVVMEKSDAAIELSITNYKTDVKTAFEMRDGWIGQIVNQGGIGTFRDQTLVEIKEVVTSEGFSSEVTKNATSITQAIQDATGTHKSIFDATGQTIENGGFRIKNQNGEVVMSISSDGYVILKDLQFSSQAMEGNSFFINALANIPQVAFAEITVGRLTLDENEFYITINGDSGYTLNEAIDKRLRYHSLIS